MNAFFKLSVGAIACALAALTVRRQNAEIALLLGVLGCCLGALLVLELLSPVLDTVQRLYERIGLEQTLLVPLLRTAGVALLTQISGAVCLDAGQTALSRVIETGGAALCLVSALPLLSAVIELIEQLAAG